MKYFTKLLTAENTFVKAEVTSVLVADRIITYCPSNPF